MVVQASAVLDTCVQHLLHETVTQAGYDAAQKPCHTENAVTKELTASFHGILLIMRKVQNKRKPQSQFDPVVEPDKNIFGKMLFNMTFVYSFIHFSVRNRLQQQRT